MPEDNTQPTGLQPSEPQHADPGQPIPAEPAQPAAEQGDTPGVNVDENPQAAEEQAPEEPLVPVVNKLDRSLMTDIAGQLGDIKKSLAAQLDQNLAPEIAAHVEKAGSHLDNVAAELHAAVTAEMDAE